MHKGVQTCAILHVCNQDLFRHHSTYLIKMLTVLKVCVKVRKPALFAIFVPKFFAVVPRYPQMIEGKLRLILFSKIIFVFSLFCILFKSKQKRKLAFEREI